MKIRMMFLCLLLLAGCGGSTGRHNLLLSDREVEVRGWLIPWNGEGPFSLFRDVKGREYWIENLPEEFKAASVQIKAKARFSRKIALAGRSSQPVISLRDVEPARVEIEKWDAELGAVYSDGSQLAAVLEALGSQIGLPLTFWPTAGGEPDESVVELGWSGCGHLHRLFVRSVPQFLPDKLLAADKAFELNETGEVIRQWAIPGNEVLLGIHGDRLLVAAPTGTLFRPHRSDSNQGYNLYLAIAPHGRFDVVQIKTPMPDFVPTSCPNIKEFEGAGYTRCAVIKDLGTAAPRRLAYQGPCT